MCAVCVCVYKCQRHVFSMPHLSTNTPAAINYAKSRVRSVGQTLLEIRSGLRGVGGGREREGRSSGKWQQQTAGGAVNAVVILHWPRPILPPSRPGACAWAGRTAKLIYWPSRIRQIAAVCIIMSTHRHSQHTYAQLDSL